MVLKVNKAKVERPKWTEIAVEAWERSHNIDATLRTLYFDSETQADLEVVLSVHNTQKVRESTSFKCPHCLVSAQPALG